jgi:hypothetical protein
VVIARMWDQFAHLDEMEAHVLDVSRLTVAEAGEAAMTALQGERLRLA